MSLGTEDGTVTMPAYLWLSVNMRGWDGNRQKAFYKLHDYIVKAGIPMTTPVTVDVADGQESIYSFLVDPQHPVRLPVQDPATVEPGKVYLRSVPARRVAVTRFGGWGYTLDEDMKHTSAKDFTVAHYDSPFWPLLGRRNEIWVDV